ncbi:MAG: hypothetical protein UU06_C0006G0012 [Parcubacteria group bacterium GW2011_GWB1_40_5]|nr:MAG: hypothetical protein UU06_C0006G0012 [Parcubacteria group bacterium GW2011_GWB1_40_5]OHA87500.1 MAG: hypothetical protein A2123_01020 [Candidatus Zambryskibacteria bacterium GWB1_40_5]
METIITLGYYVSSLSFLLASIITALAVRKFGESTLGSIFSYLFIGTEIIFVITVFQKLGSDFFLISEASVDIWVHIMLYLALFSYYFGFRALVGLVGNSSVAVSNPGHEGGKTWGIFAIVMLVIIFILPNKLESFIGAYTGSLLAGYGFHYYLACLWAGMAGTFLIRAKKYLGQIGRAIANPMTVAIWTLAVMEFWSLLAKTWKVVDLSPSSIEGVEKLFLIIASVSVTYGALHLRSLAKV